MDGQFDRLRQRFRARAAKDAERLEGALERGDEESIRTTAHSLSGSGAIFGFPRISALAEPLETAAEAGACWADLRNLTESLLAELRTTAQAA